MLSGVLPSWQWLDLAVIFPLRRKMCFLSASQHALHGGLEGFGAPWQPLGHRGDAGVPESTYRLHCLPCCSGSMGWQVSPQAARSAVAMPPIPGQPSPPWAQQEPGKPLQPTQAPRFPGPCCSSANREQPPGCLNSLSPKSSLKTCQLLAKHAHACGMHSASLHSAPGFCLHVARLVANSPEPGVLPRNRLHPRGLATQGQGGGSLSPDATPLFACTLESRCLPPALGRGGAPAWHSAGMGWHRAGDEHT